MNNQIPDLWWSPSHGGFLTRHENNADEHLVWIVHTTHESLRHHLGTGADSNPPLPTDAVRLVLDDPETRRPVVLLRAEDCACAVGGDCAHGPEPVDALDLAVWLHAEAVWQREHARNLFLDHYNAASCTADRIAQLEAALRERTDQRDALQARVAAQQQAIDLDRAQNEDCAEKVDTALGHRYHRPGLHYSIPHVAEKAAAELKQLQARIDAIVETLGRAAGMMATDSRDWGRDRGDAWLYGLLVGWGCEEQHQHDYICGGPAAMGEVATWHGWSNDDTARLRRFRAALQGEPAEPKEQS
ncbi:hypothetical protein ACWEF6_02835 [Amycolatopsis sp. NPDC004772]